MKKTLPILFLSFFLFSQTLNSYGSFGKKSDDKEVSVNPDVVNTVPSVEAVQSAMEEFKSLPKKERKDRFKEVKKAIKEFKAQKKAGGDADTNTLLLVLLGILIPPLAVYLHEGSTNNKFWLNVILTILGFVLFGFAGSIFLGSIPGIIHALIVILS
jgi:uncharacterized membrane protein YqaE (UPF0057 family)